MSRIQKLFSIVYLLGFLTGIYLILTSDTGYVTSYVPAIISGVITSCFSGCLWQSSCTLGTRRNAHLNI